MRAVCAPSRLASVREMIEKHGVSCADTRARGDLGATSLPSSTVATMPQHNNKLAGW
jgi:hypothetical protein